MKRLIWVLNDFRSVGLPELTLALEGQGYASEIREISGTGSAVVDALKAELSGPVDGVLIGSKDVAWLVGTVKALREANDGALRFIPFLALDTDDHRTLWEKLPEAGVEDVFEVTGHPLELALRLQLRAQETAHRAKLDVESKDHLVRIAKTETILKQREEFLGVCAHDLRSPLGLIQSSLSMVLNGSKGATALPTMHQELLTRAKRQAGYALTLVNDLLDVTALDQGLKPQYQMLDLHALLNEFYKDYSFQAEQKKIRFHYENPIQAWRVLADSDRIRQLLQNLFGNALKFTESGKNIYLNVTPFKGRRKTDPVYPMIIISLKDEGKGIPSNEVQKIFDRFSQLKDSARSEGRGLGLTVSKQISNLHDGNLWVQSAEGQGSTFFTLFPHVISRTDPPSQKTPKPVLVIAEPSVAKRELYFKGWAESYDLIFARDGVESLTLLFHFMPAALILTPNLAKLDEVEAANIAKGDPLTTAIPLFLGLEDEQKPLKKHENMLFDKALSLPLGLSDFEREVKAMTFPSKKPSPKKAA